MLGERFRNFFGQESDDGEGSLGGYWDDVREITHYLDTGKLIIKYGTGTNYMSETLQGVTVAQLSDACAAKITSFMAYSKVVYKALSGELWVCEISPKGTMLLIDKSD